MVPVVPGSSGQVRSLVHGGTSSTSSNSSLSNNPSVTITLQVSPSGSSGPMDQGPSAAKQLVQQHSPPMGHHSAPSPPTSSYVKQNCDQQATIGYSANASLVIRPSSMGPNVPGVSPHQQLTAAAGSPSGGGGASAAVGRPFVMTPLASSIQAHGSASSSSSIAAVQAAASHQAAVQAVLATAANTAPHHSHHPHHHQTCLSEAVTITID